MAQKTLDYRKVSDELDALLDRLQAGDITIDEALPAYERGMKLVAELEAYLQTAENRIAQLQAKRQD